MGSMANSTRSPLLPSGYLIWLAMNFSSPFFPLLSTLSPLSSFLSPLSSTLYPFPSHLSPLLPYLLPSFSFFSPSLTSLSFSFARFTEPSQHETSDMFGTSLSVESLEGIRAVDIQRMQVFPLPCPHESFDPMCMKLFPSPLYPPLYSLSSFLFSLSSS